MGSNNYFTVGVGLILTLLALAGLNHHWAGPRFVGAALMWAGGTSNLIDRAACGSVVDFINVGVGSLRTGIFNVADLAIVFGFALVMIGSPKTRE